jgi:hypothetical protein
MPLPPLPPLQQLEEERTALAERDVREARVRFDAIAQRRQV